MRSTHRSEAAATDRWNAARMVENEAQKTRAVTLVLTTGPIPQRRLLVGDSDLFVLCRPDTAHAEIMGLNPVAVIPDISQWPTDLANVIRCRINPTHSKVGPLDKTQAAIREAILRAASNGHLTVTSLPARHGPPVPCLCAVVEKAGEPRRVVPFAKLWPGNPYEELEPPPGPPRILP